MPVNDDITTPLDSAISFRVTESDLPREPDRIVVRTEDLDSTPYPSSGQVWVAVDFSALGWVPANFTVPDHVPVGDFELRPFVPGAASHH